MKISSSFLQVLFEVLRPQSEAMQLALERLNIKTIRDLMLYKPNYYLQKKLNPDVKNINDGDNVILTVEIAQIQRSHKSKILQGTVNYKDAIIRIVFFRTPPAFVIKILYNQKVVKIVGKITIVDGNMEIHHPEIVFSNNDIDLIEPIYPLTYGITNKQLYAEIKAAIHKIQNIPDINLEELKTAICNIHIPKSMNLDQYYKTISFLELIAHNAAMQILKTQVKECGRNFQINHELQKQILTKLNFTLTDGQQQALEEIEHDQQNHKMMRLLQGDVGVGKTLVALLSALNVLNYAQVAMMCPTDMLSTQHYNFFTQALSELDIKVALLTGSTTTKERKKILSQLAEGSIRIIIGTHALFQEEVKFYDLGYVIIDEQHRFGVMQRFALTEKGINPDVLIMTATPIPRSLCLALFGDIDTSKITTRISDRLPVITATIGKNRIHDVINQLNEIVKRGERIYWVCPLIEKEEESETHLQDAQIRFMELKEIYGDKVGLATGKTNSKDRTEIIRRFYSGEILILVATTIVEVGIDVKDATLIIVEDAQQFGLAQLHQLRGRVGRGNKQSFCILLYNEKRLSKVAKERLMVLKNSADGFYIAEQDLVLRGSGEIFGVNQSGLQKFFFFNEQNDVDLLSKVNCYKINIGSEYIKTLVQVFVKRDLGAFMKIG